ncbi:sensor histidine kinase [Acanthopleuribacter pedis]|uniref:histidine kinase n=1 Tax=Acanthopleuribacter pedis TaxID=442870 RepID=A0A8J7QG30_9BACT|nr:ATP-binding protein [Acanthopleuribacter pedis]MBO1319370.1 GHKL domain-containing protein [Acanthopleuribacter pedis]
MNERAITAAPETGSFWGSIRARIMLGFLLLILGIGLISGVSYSGFNLVKNEFNTFRNLNERATMVLELNREVSEVQRYVQVFSYTGHDSVADRTLVVVGEIEGRLTDLKRLNRDNNSLALLKRMEGHLKVYRGTFLDAVEQRRLRKRLEDEELALAHRQLEQALKNYRAGKNHNRDLGRRLFFEIKSLEENLFNYLLQLEAYPLEQSLVTIEALDRELAKEPGQDAVFLRQAISGLTNLSLRIMQATRSFLYLTGVVMAGEALEFSYVSAGLRDSILDEMNPVISRIQNNTNRTQSFNLIFSVACMILGLFFSVFIGLSITQPIRAVSVTLLKLSRGEKTSIPGVDRKDEIGIMARAAGVFAKRNEETEHLLARSQELTQELDQHKRELERSNNEMEQFVYTVSHDLKSPVVTSMGFIGMMKVFAAQGKAEEALQKLPTLEKANRRMSELINDLLDLSRVGRAETDMERLDMNEVLQNVQTNLVGLIEMYPAEIVIQKNLPEIRGNEIRVSQVFDNLMSNALKYTSLITNPIIEVGGEQDADSVHYYVKDNGNGIPKRHHDRVFGLFQRLDVSVEGTGIGLAIVKKIMKTHHGKVWIESEGNGCTFHLEFPRHGETATQRNDGATHEGSTQ